ncbi:hypothetical protein BB560_000885 [Smittium megazygosporum]|uniref:Uncharacterized protein n=1 Tax=Smittium megazygosporum TaxID=133381 RepID=A0A2T9ZJ46_9FUNG|nr:hypothetical protein BB560_000885 [Smittium megazygosporum]
MSNKEIEDLEIDDMLDFYQKQLDQNEKDFKNFDKHLKNLEIKHSEMKQLQWAFQEKDEELAKLRELYEETQNSLIEERRNHLQVVAINDKLKIKLQKKNSQIEYLASKINESQLLIDERDSTFKNKRNRSEYQGENSNSIASDTKMQDLLIENETLSLSVETMRIQLEEQKLNFDEMISSLRLELQNVKDTERAKNIELSRKIEESTLRVYNIQSLYRENVKEMLELRKLVGDNKRLIDEDQFILRSKILSLEKESKNKDKTIKDLEKEAQNSHSVGSLAEIDELEYRLNQSRKEFSNLQNDHEVEQTKLKQTISRLEILNEKLQQDLSIAKKDQLFYMNSVFAECIEIKKLLVEAGKLRDSVGEFNSNAAWSFQTNFDRAVDRLDNLMLYIQRSKPSVNSNQNTPSTTKTRMRSLFDIVANPERSR